MTRSASRCDMRASSASCGIKPISPASSGSVMNTPASRISHRIMVGPPLRVTSFPEDERQLEAHAILGDLAVVDHRFLARHPGCGDVLEGLPGALGSLRD